MLPNAGPDIYDATVFKVLLEYEINRSRRYISPLALLRIVPASILSHESKHPQAMKAIASILNISVRKADVPARVGEEFIVLLPNTDEPGAKTVCIRLLRVTMGTQNTPLGFSSPAAICIGMSSHPGGPQLDADRLIQEAGLALLEARGRGSQVYISYSEIARSNTRPTSRFNLPPE